MKWTLSIFIVSLFLYSCKPAKKDIRFTRKYIDKNWLDSIIKRSDSNYTKPYGRTDFVTATYYINKKDSTVAQLMKDSSGSIRQVLVSKNNIRCFFAQYYPGGQLMAALPLDEQGQNNGHSIYYYNNGAIQSQGEYVHGFHSGTWKNYDSAGNAAATDMYDSNGARMIK